jgi:MFS family permease
MQAKASDTLHSQALTLNPFRTDATLEHIHLQALQDLAREVPSNISLQQLEQTAAAWAAWIPDDPLERAELARLLSEHYALSALQIPNIRAALGLDRSDTKAAFFQRYHHELESIYRAKPEEAPPINPRRDWQKLPPALFLAGLLLGEMLGVGLLALPLVLAPFSMPVAALMIFGAWGVHLLCALWFLGAFQCSPPAANSWLSWVRRYLGGRGAQAYWWMLLSSSVGMLSVHLLGLAHSLEGLGLSPGQGLALALLGLGCLLITQPPLNMMLMGGLKLLLCLALLGLLLPNWSSQNLPTEPKLHLGDLQNVGGVLLLSLMGHMSLGSYAQTRLRERPQSLLGGVFLAYSAGLVIVLAWVLAFKGRYPAAELGAEAHTIVGVLGEGPALVGTLLAWLIFGQGAWQTSTRLIATLLEWLPRQIEQHLILPRHQGRILLRRHRFHHEVMSLSLVYQGIEGDYPGFYLESQVGGVTRRWRLYFWREWESGDWVAELPPPLQSGVDLQLRVLRLAPEAVHLAINTTLQLSYKGDWAAVAAAQQALRAAEATRPANALMRSLLIHPRSPTFAELGHRLGWSNDKLQPRLQSLQTEGVVATWLDFQGQARYEFKRGGRRLRGLATGIWRGLDPQSLRQTSAQEVPRLSDIGLIGLSWGLSSLLSRRYGRLLLALIPLLIASTLAGLWLHTPLKAVIHSVGLLVATLLVGFWAWLLNVAARQKGELAPPAFYQVLSQVGRGGPFYALLLVHSLFQAVFIRGEWWQSLGALVLAGILGLAWLTLLGRGSLVARIALSWHAEGEQAELRLTRKGRPYVASLTLIYADGRQVHAQSDQMRLQDAGRLRVLRCRLQNKAPEEVLVRLPPPSAGEAFVDILGPEGLARYDVAVQSGRILHPLRHEGQELEIRWA